MFVTRTALSLLLMAVAALAGAQSPAPEVAGPSSEADAQDDANRLQRPAEAEPAATAPAVPVAPARPAPVRRPARSGTRISADSAVAFPADI